jgi:hypothetical protein
MVAAPKEEVAAKGEPGALEVAQTIRFDGGLGGFFGHAGPVEE